MKRYIIPETISEEIFNLECVSSINKSGQSGVKFYLTLLSSKMDENSNQWHFAHIGDTLVHLDNDKWKLEKKGNKQ